MSQWNFIYKNRWWAGFGPWAMVCQAPFKALPGKRELISSFYLLVQKWPGSPHATTLILNSFAELSGPQVPLSYHCTSFTLLVPECGFPCPRSLLCSCYCLPLGLWKALSWKPPALFTNFSFLKRHTTFHLLSEAFLHKLNPPNVFLLNLCSYPWCILVLYQYVWLLLHTWASICFPIVHT